ncbi:hypothetical protein [Streptomyces turgidiscabies]|uniref:MFS family arabinose efflux permease n=1 Tax=Streptomyces turgidiscabies TaxID=85558 RepID=A0ABU0RQF6_9ACTN|nr:hypothetical protein [Streptomyces turgidiscabies]MDQ0933180.1 putative MFS family arabinose efflux permease [Streptomyces turgidiscabies]
MKYASDAPAMASGANIAAFNVGNALDAWIGGLTLAAGYGFVSPLWVGAALGVAGLGVAVAASRGGSPSGSRAGAPGVARRAENVDAGIP